MKQLRFTCWLMFLLLTINTLAQQLPARALHFKVLTIDSHTDTPLWMLRGGIDFMKDNSAVRGSRVDFPRMLKGGLDAVFFAVFTSQGTLDTTGYQKAYRRATELFDSIHSLVVRNNRQLALSLSARDIEQNASNDKVSILIGVENGYPIGNDISRVREFFDRGARYITLSHTRNNQICDSSNDTVVHDGLSAFGREVVIEMNRLGMMVDVSHISDKAFRDVMEITTKPVIASHSSARAVCSNPRNLTDDMLRAIASNKGVVQVCILSDYVKEMPRDARRDSAFSALYLRYNNFEGLDEETLQKARAEYAATDRLFPRLLASVADLVDHIDHIAKVAGIDYVGIGTDFDGGGGLADCRDVSELPNITIELKRRGYSDNDIEQIWGKNLLRVMRAQQDMGKL